MDIIIQFINEGLCINKEDIKNNIVNMFITRLKKHKIYSLINNDNCINNKLIIDILKDKKTKLNNKIYLLDSSELSKIKQKKILRLIRNYKQKLIINGYYSNTESNRNEKYKLNSKLKLGYFEYSHHYKNKIIDFWVDNNLDIYPSSKKTQFDKITEFMIMKKYHNIDISQLSRWEIRTHIKKCIKLLYPYIPDGEYIILSIADTLTLIHNTLNPYIIYYNKMIRKSINRIPHIPTFLNNSRFGYYYTENNRALNWDYENSDNWYIDWNNPIELLNHIDYHTKLNTLKCIHFKIIKLTNYNKNNLEKFINNFSKDKLVSTLELCNIEPNIFVSCCQEYYSNMKYIDLINKF